MSRFALGLTTLALVLVTGACQDDPEPKIADPTSEVPRVNRQATRKRRTRAQNRSRSLQSRPFESWIEGHNQALLHGDFGAVDALSLPNCKTCSEYLDPMRDVFASGGRFETEPWRIEGIKSRKDQGAPHEVSVGCRHPGRSDLSVSER